MVSKIKRALAIGLVLVMCIPAFSGMNASAEKTNNEEVTTMMELPDLEKWHYKIPIIVDTGYYNRTDCVLSQNINITREIGGFGTFDENSVRVIETMEDGTPVYEVVSQYRWITEDVLDVTWLMNGTTPANTQRYYSIYFDILENGPKNTTTYTEYVATKENKEHIWVYGDDYEIKIDKDRGGSRLLKINDVPRKGFVEDTTWQSWHSESLNWKIKGASITIVENGPIYKTVKIVSSDNSQIIYWYFYPDKMKIVTEEEYGDVCFDTIADNLNNKDGTLVWGDGATENLTKDYKEYNRVTNFFYILDPELNSSNDDVKGRSGFWADTTDNKNQTVINAGEKGTKWTLGGNSAWFGFAKNDVIRDVVLRSQNPPEITREYSWIILESPIIEDEKVFENQVVVIKGDLTVTNSGTLLSIDSSLIVHGNITIEENGELYIVSSREFLPSEPPGEPPVLPPLPPRPPRPPRPPIRPPVRSAIVAGDVFVNGEFFIAKDSLSLCSEKDEMNGIHVNSIGVFESYDATITAFSDEIPVSITNQKVCYEKCYYNFDIYGEAQIDNCKISYLYDGVRILNGSDVSIQNSHISDSAGNGIFIDENCTPIIKGNTITNCGNAGIFIDPVILPDAGEGINNDTNPVFGIDDDNITNGTNYDVVFYPSENTSGVQGNDTYTTVIVHNIGSSFYGGGWGVGTDEMPVIKDGSDCVEVIHAYDGMLSGWVTSPAPGGCVWLWDYWGKSSVQVTSTVDCDVIYVQFAYSDYNDGWADIYVDNTLVYSIYTRYMGYWYLEIRDIPYSMHTVKVSTRSWSGDLHPWYFGFGDKIGVNQPPVAKVSECQITAEVGDTITFDGSSSYDPDGSIVKYSWDFYGFDGIQEDAIGKKVTYSYSTLGINFVTLTVTDNSGATDTDYFRVVVWAYDWGPSYEQYITKIEDCTFSGNTIGIYVGQYPCEEEVGEYISTPYANIINCRVYNNNIGIRCNYAGAFVIRSYIFYNDISVDMMNKGTIIPVESSYDTRTLSFDYDDYYDFYALDDGNDNNDGDAWTDMEEVYVYGFNPYINDPDKENNNANFDGEGYSNVKEGEIYGTDPLNPDTDNDEIADYDEINGINPRYVVDKGNKGYLFYNVAPVDYSKVFMYHTNPLNPDTDLDGQNDYNDLIPLDYDMDGDGMINSLEIITSSSSYYVDRLAIAANNDPNLIRSAGVFVEDDDMDEDGKKVVFSDGFETDLNKWSKTTCSASVIQRTAKSHSGSYSVEVYQTKDVDDTVLYKTFTAQKTGTVTFWFYDNSGVTGAEVVGLRDNGNGDVSVHQYWIGIRRDKPSIYVYRVGNTWYDTTISRTTGWHKIWFVADGEYVRGGIDDTLIKTTKYIKTFNRIEIGSYWTCPKGIYVDDVSVSDDTDIDNDGMDNGYEIGYGVANNGWQNPYIYNARYAVLIGGGSTDSGKNYNAFWNDIKKAYNVIVEDYNYNPENVYVYYWSASEGQVKDGITLSGHADYWKVYHQAESIGSKATINDFFFFLITAHASGEKEGKIGEGFTFYEDGKEVGRTYAGVDMFLDFVRVERKVVVTTSCLDGDGLDDLSADFGEKRIVITATNGDEYARPWKYDGPFMINWDHAEFLYNDKGDGFLRGLAGGETSVKEAFKSGVSAAGDMDTWGGWVDVSHPRLDDNGDGVYDSGDGSLATVTYI